MNPHETQEILNQLTATWPRNPISDDTADAWAAALVAIDFETAKRAVLAHSMSERGHFPPDIADVAAAMRQKQRAQRPADQNLARIQADKHAAYVDATAYAQRINAAQNKVGQTTWLKLLDQARKELVTEYGHSCIPTRLIGNRAARLAESWPK